MGTLKASILILIGLAALGGGAAFLHEDGLERLGLEVGLPQEPSAANPVAEAPSPDAALDESDTSSLPAESTSDAAVLQIAPAIDVVRVEPDGSALVSGTAVSGATVEVLVDGSPVWSGLADARGAFVAFVDLPPSLSARTLSLRSDDGDGSSLPSEASVVLAPSPEVPLAETPDPVPLPSSEAEGEANMPPQVASLTAPALENAPDGVRPLAPAPVDPDQGLALDSVRYGAEGEVILEGRAEAGARALSIYLDGRVAARARTTLQGDWQAVLDDVPSGDYRLRADLTDEAGQVAGRVDLPFRREAPEILEAARVAASEADQSAALLTVQPGFSLWAIARDRYGDGFQYVAVYEANAEEIDDPDLIFPGQVLTLPAGPAAPDATGE